MILSSALAGNL
jgi:hypothetical protein